jgi:hypothetical protein
VAESLKTCGAGIRNHPINVRLAGEISGDSFHFGIVEQKRVNLVAEQGADPVRLMADERVGGDVGEFRAGADAASNRSINVVPSKCVVGRDVEVFLQRCSVPEQTDERDGEIFAEGKWP